MINKKMHLTEKIGRAKKELLESLTARIRPGELAGTVSPWECCVRITLFL